MKIRDIRIRVCRNHRELSHEYQMRSGGKSGFEFIVVSVDVSWEEGATPVMKTAHLAESFGVECEMPTTIYNPLEIVNLHCCCGISNCEFLELPYPIHALRARTAAWRSHA